MLSHRVPWVPLGAALVFGDDRRPTLSIMRPQGFDMPRSKPFTFDEGKAKEATLAQAALNAL